MKSEKKKAVGRPKTSPSLLEMQNSEISADILSKVSVSLLKIAQTFEKERIAQDIPKGELAKKANISYQNYYNLEQGKKRTTIATIESLAEALNFTLENVCLQAFQEKTHEDTVNSVEQLLTYPYHYIYSHSLVDKIGKSAISIELDATMALRIITKMLNMAEQIIKKPTEKGETTEIEYALKTVKKLIENIEKNSEIMKKDIIDNI